MATNVASASVARRARRPPSSSRVGRLASSDTLEPGGFTPGTILAERYRIIGLLGRGGMGEVYRADDLKLGQPVALKFLPDRLSEDPALLDRFFAEVRLARQVAHPNVCRVYDIGEADGRHFLSMEYVDGEDLASLLRRIGRLPQDKALQISRQLCAGLAAAHDRGILHRDLKPANVMVDGRGRARIMDFSLAVASDGSDRSFGGTFAYMAPEQFRGEGASVRSDVYALGLVLYELHTGRQAFDADSLVEYGRKHAEDTPTEPSAIVKEMDAAVERVILRCLEKDPAQRPSSVAKVAAALPGGDPLAAALAAGETPSPEMVAAAGSRGALSPSAARYLLLALAAGLALAFVFVPRMSITAFVHVDKPPDALRERARDILQSLDAGTAADSASWFTSDGSFAEWARNHGGLRGDLSRDAVAFVYRQARSLAPNLALTGPFPSPTVTSDNPAPIEPGMAEVRVDPKGRLVRLEIVPPAFQEIAAPPRPTDWSPLFREAGLEIGRFTRVSPKWSPRSYATERAAWEGPHPERPGVTMRVDAASYDGRPVGFRWSGPWTNPDRPTMAAGSTSSELILEGILFLCLVGGAMLVRRNLRSGRSDRRGALRLAAGIGGLTLLMWVFGGYHVQSPAEGWVFLEAFNNAGGTALLYWITYVALEPFARRRWPEMLISWQRALSGRWRDPLVGRDALVGAVVGTFAGLLLGPARALIPAKLGLRALHPQGLFADAPISLGATLAWLLSCAVIAVFIVLGIVFFLILVRRLVRFGWLAAVIVTLVFSGTYLDPSAGFVPGLLAILSVAVLVFTTVRFGVLVGVVAHASGSFVLHGPLSGDPSNWAFYAGMIALALIAAIGGWGAKTALAGKPLFGGVGEESSARRAEA
jgi:serine/threonine-protein kinase